MTRATSIAVLVAMVILLATGAVPPAVAPAERFR